MAEAFDIETLRRKPSSVMERRNVRPTTLSLKVGKSPTLVKDLLEKTDDTKLSTLYKLAAALDVDPSDLIHGDIEPLPAGPKIYLKGEVAAGAWLDAFEWPHDDWQAMTGRPDVLADPQHRFFLRVKGDSMDQVYPDGSLIECVNTFARIEPKPGRNVVILRTRSDQRVEATVKEMVEIDGKMWFVPRSSNPAHQAFSVDAVDPDIEEMRIAAVVVSSVRPE